MKKELRIKRKKLDNAHYDLLFQVSKYLQSANLTKYAFYKLRDDAIEEIYDAQMEGIPADKVYKRGIDTHFKKECDKLPKMSIFEQISNISMVFFGLFTILSIFVYIYHFIGKTNLDYSEGIYLHLSVSTLINMVMYGFIAAILWAFIQKIDKTRKIVQAVTIGVVGAVSILVVMGVGNGYDGFRLNMVIIIPALVALTILFYFVTDIIAKSKYKKGIKN